MKKYLILLATAMLAFSCSDDKDPIDPNGNGGPNPPADEAFLELDMPDLSFTKQGGSLEVTVTSSSDWDLLGDDEWFSPSIKHGKNGDKVTFTVAPNRKADEYSTVFKFLGEDGGLAKLPVKQMAGDELKIATTDFPMVAGGGKILVEVEASGEFTCTMDADSPWLTRTEPEVAPAAALAKTTVELVAAANDEGKAREATVIFELGDVSVPVTVKQVQNDVVRAIAGEPTSFQFEPDAASFQFRFEANIAPVVTVSNSGNGWLTAGTPAASSTEAGVVEWTIDCSATQNEEADRSATITIACPSDPTMNIVLTVKQKGVAAAGANIPDAKFRQKLFELGYIESADNEYCILTEEGIAAKTINVSASGITDLTGIEAFEFLETLNVGNTSPNQSGKNKITRLDLSKNKYIKSLNVNVLPLEYLDMGDINGIREFYLQNMDSKTFKMISTGITYMEFGSSSLTGYPLSSVDLSECTGFVTVKFNFAQKLTGEMDLSKCMNITNVYINKCKLNKVILPKSREGQVTLYSKDAATEEVYQ